MSKKIKARKAGERMVKTIAGVEFAFRYCPAGTFTMGSPSSEGGSHDDEKQHKVTLSKGFWMMETQVTQAQWKAVMGNTPSYYKGDTLPVERVSWDDCVEFCKKLSQLSGQKIQLPTEAQWEYSCRAGTTGAFAGDLDAMVWYNSNSGLGTRPVGTKKPNAWGLYDMHGNVSEWCTDWYDGYPSDAVMDPTGPSSGTSHVLRGGGWRNYARYCRSAHRGDYSSLRADFVGFRLVQD